MQQSDRVADAGDELAHLLHAQLLGRLSAQLPVGELVISCPHALGLAIPLTTSPFSVVGARTGVLVKDRQALERSLGGCPLGYPHTRT